MSNLETVRPEVSLPDELTILAGRVAREDTLLLCAEMRNASSETINHIKQMRRTWSDEACELFNGDLELQGEFHRQVGKLVSNNIFNNQY